MPEPNFIGGLLMGPNEPKGPGFTVLRVLSLVLWSLLLISHSLCLVLYPDGRRVGLNLVMIVASLFWIRRACRGIKYGDN